MSAITRSTGQRVTAGDMTEIISFERETRTPDNLGGFTSAWAVAASAWAAVYPVFVNEREVRGAVRSETQYRFVAYADGSVTEDMRIVWQGRTLNIQGIRRGMARDLTMEIIATDGVTD